MLGHEVNQAGCIAVHTGGWHDHVHVVCGFSRIISIADLVEHMKVNTSKWAKDTPLGVPTFSWQSGYGVFSISHSNLPLVVRYAKNRFIRQLRLEPCKKKDMPVPSGVRF